MFLFGGGDVALTLVLRLFTALPLERDEHWGGGGRKDMGGKKSDS